MARTDALREAVRPFLVDVLAGKDSRPLVHYLTVRSNLPGPRANFELAEALAEEMVAHVDEKGAVFWGVVAAWAEIDAQEAPSGNPLEFMPVCAAVCIGALGASAEMWWLSALDRLRDLAADPREMVRRAVVSGLRHMLRANFLQAADEFIGWIESGQPREMRAIGEAIAEPLLVTEKINAAAALALHRALINTYILLPLTWRDKPEYRDLRKTLAHSLSVAVAAEPEEGFEAIRRWGARHDPELVWLLIQNLTQARLANVYQAETESLIRQLKDKT